MPVVVHHLENSRSQRVLWLLEELGLEYRVERYPRDKKTSLAPEALRAIHPLGKSPLLEDSGRVYAETGNIVEHLVETYGGGRLRPEIGTEAFERYRFWMHYAEGSLMPILLLRLIFNRIKEGPVPFFIKPIAKGIVDKVSAAFIDPQTALHFSYIDKEIGKTKWFCGEELTAADIMMSFPLEAAGTRLDLDQYPNVARFVKEVHALPNYQKALEKGGPYAYA